MDDEVEDEGQRRSRALRGGMKQAHTGRTRGGGRHMVFRLGRKGSAGPCCARGWFSDAEASSLLRRCGCLLLHLCVRVLCVLCVVVVQMTLPSSTPRVPMVVVCLPSPVVPRPKWLS
jgi:hypothetical protein